MPAFIWFLFRMHFQMLFKITYWWKSLCTLPALIWFLPRLYSKIPHKMNIHKKTSHYFPWKTLAQCLHLYGFSSECIFNCHLRSHISEKVFAHCLHWYGFSPVCILKCPIGWIFTKDVTLFFLEKLWHNAYTYMVSLQNVFSNVI